ncbi:hypothetical protein CSIM01_12987 [Colletotrichum simmondsii]|uniref:Uncharacterized protein n=1 Tax=Colletotrichum simmondsii TaxID=703756 RepID=A0A135RMZ7_9PEZI|nr:hypothetical protein CSIM01_12987 [Colletotrichum simmondsii]
MHILSTVARSITSRSLARVEQIQPSHGSYVRFFSCSCSLCGAEAPRPAEDGMHHSRLTLPGSGPVIVEHSKGGANQAGAADSQAVSLQPPERPKAPSAWGSFGSKIAKARPIPKVVKKGPAPTGGKARASGSVSSLSNTTTTASSTRKARSAKQNPSPPASAQWGTFHALQVQGPAPNPNPPPKPKLLSRPRAGAPAPRWKRNSLPARARAGKWGGFHQEQGAPASGHVDDGGLVVHDGHWSIVDPVVEGGLEPSLETSLSKDVSDISEEVGAKEVPSEVLTEQPVLSNPQHRQNVASVSISKRGKERARAVPRTRSRRSGLKSAAGLGTGSWGNFFEDIERSDPELAGMTGNEEEADAPAPSRSIADDTASSSAYVSSERDATYRTKVYPEPTPDFYEDILPLPSKPHEPNASKAEGFPALGPRAGPGFITQAEAAALIDRLSHQRRADGTLELEEDERRLHLLRLEEHMANFATRKRQDWLALRNFLKSRIPWHFRNSELRHVLMDQKEGQSWKGALLERLRNGGDDRGDIVTEKGSRRDRRRHR